MLTTYCHYLDIRYLCPCFEGRKVCEIAKFQVTYMYFLMHKETIVNIIKSYI